MLFGRKDIETQLVSITQKWFDAYDSINPVLELFFDGFYHKELYQSSLFLNYIIAIETYHRRNSNKKKMDSQEFKQLKESIKSKLSEKELELVSDFLSHSNELTLKSRLEDIILDLPKVFELFDLDKKLFINKVRNTRNFFVHFDERFEGNFQKIINEDDMLKFNIYLSLILRSLILKSLGFNEEDIILAIKRIDLLGIVLPMK